MRYVWDIANGDEVAASQLQREVHVECMAVSTSGEYVNVWWQQRQHHLVPRATYFLIVVESPKTAHHPGRDRRVNPLFPELRPILEEACELC